MKYFTLIIITLLLLNSCSDKTPYQSEVQADISYPGIHSYFSKRGIGPDYSEKNAALLQGHIQDLINRIESRSADQDEIPKHDQEKLDYLTKALELVGASLNPAAPEKDKVAGYHIARRVIYGLLSVDAEEELPRWRERINDFFGALVTFKRFVFKYFLFKVPYKNEKDRLTPVGLSQAKLEAERLVDPNNRENYISREGLAKLSHVEIADLDIGDLHPVWHTKEYIKNHPNSWKDLEQWMEQNLTNRVMSKRDFAREFPNFKYRLASARKVLFFDRLKNSATAPKINTRDAYGIRWKLKWGAEMQPEVVANRLYMKLGGKFTDLVYVNGPKKSELVLILGDPSKAEEKREKECYPLNAEEFDQCLLKSVYKFKLTPYINESGLITEANVDNILADLPHETPEGKRREDLIGRHFVTFNESMIELKPSGFIERGGPAAFSSNGAVEDRVGRGLFLYNMWVWNMDAKDDNNRAVLANNFLNTPGTTYLEFQHDQGVTFGGLLTTGLLNGFGVGTSFMRISKWSGVIRFNQALGYYPRAWRKTTYADALWMANKIVSLTRKDIEEIVAFTKWPDFMQETLVYKLMARRNRIARIFNIQPSDGEWNLKANNFSVDLSTEAHRQAAADKYGLSLATIEEAMQVAGLAETPYIDPIVNNGRIKRCDRSLLIGLLETYRHPAGLSRRVFRFSDHRALRPCGYGYMSWQDQIQDQVQEQQQAQDQDQVQEQAQSQVQDQHQVQEQYQEQVQEQEQEQVQVDL